MKIKTLRPAFRDRRGAITDILDGVDFDSITIITSRKGCVRGNHYHKKTTQWLYLLEGRLAYLSRRGAGAVRRALMRAGDLAVSPPGEAHAAVSLTDTVFLAVSSGPRHGKNFEADTFRLKAPLA